MYLVGPCIKHIVNSNTNLANQGNSQTKNIENKSFFFGVESVLFFNKKKCNRVFHIFTVLNFYVRFVTKKHFFRYIIKKHPVVYFKIFFIGHLAYYLYYTHF